MYDSRDERIHLGDDDKIEEGLMRAGITEEITSSDDVMMMSSHDDNRQEDEGDVSVKMTMPSMNDNGINSTVESQDDVIRGGGDDVELRDDVMSNDTGISGHIVGDTDEVISRMSNNGHKDVVIPAPSMSSKGVNQNINVERCDINKDR